MTESVTRKDIPWSPPNSGIALVIVLGLLAALMVMALGFATFMRTERMAAANYAAIAQTRQLMLAALDTVIEDINNNLIPTIYPSNLWYTTNAGERVGDAEDLLYGKIGVGGTKHFLTHEVLTDRDPNPTDANWDTKWYTLADISNNLIGVYAFFIANESGRIDLNRACRAPYDEGARNAATNLYLQELSNIQGADNLLNIYNNLTDVGRYYSQPHLKYGNETNFTQGYGGGGIPYNWPSDDHFTTYAKYVQKYTNSLGEDLNRALLAGTDTELSTREEAIKRALEDGGVASNMVDQTYLNILDYVDTDFIPRADLSQGIAADSYANGEAIPMINEVVVTHRLTPNRTMTESAISISVELWYPFEEVVNNRDYEVEIRGAVSNPQNTDFNVPFYTAPFLRTPVATPINGWQKNDFGVAFINLPSTTSTNPPNTAQMTLILQVKLYDSQVPLPVDSVGTIAASLADAFTFGPNIFTSTVPGMITTSRSANDPRVNWSASYWSTPNAFPVTLGAINDPGYYIPGADGILYVANRQIKNIGELGFVRLGDDTPWRSIQLTGPEAGVLDTLTVHEETNVFGLVNINSDDPEVLASALYGARTEDYPDDTNNMQTVSWEKALTLGNAIKMNRPDGGYTSRSSMVATNVMELQDGATGENAQESIIRTSFDMMDVRGNTFTIILRVRSVKDWTSKTNPEPDWIWDEGVDVVLGEQQAVAQIWRDPVSKETQITFFKWIAYAEE